MNLHYMLIASGLLLLTGCAATTPVSSDEWTFADFDLKLPENQNASARESERCPEPKPKGFGCKYLCKPCIRYICINGQWEELQYDWKEDPFCQPRPRPNSPRPSACPRSEVGFCPAECSFCF